MIDALIESLKAFETFDSMIDYIWLFVVLNLFASLRPTLGL